MTRNFSRYMSNSDPIVKKTIFDFDSTCIGINRFLCSTFLLFYFYSLTSFCIFPTRISIHVVSSGRYSFIKRKHCYRFSSTKFPLLFQNRREWRSFAQSEIRMQKNPIRMCNEEKQRN